jgi:hypothetical protein
MHDKRVYHLFPAMGRVRICVNLGLIPALKMLLWVFAHPQIARCIRVIQRMRGERRSFSLVELSRQRNRIARCQGCR